MSIKRISLALLPCSKLFTVFGDRLEKTAIFGAEALMHSSAAATCNEDFALVREMRAKGYLPDEVVGIYLDGLAVGYISGYASNAAANFANTKADNVWCHVGVWLSPAFRGMGIYRAICQSLGIKISHPYYRPQAGIDFLSWTQISSMSGTSIEFTSGVNQAQTAK